jgi:uncharacterized protein YbjT (DUF2867 family)
MKTAIIAGATGLIGRECVARLLADADIRAVHALVRCKSGVRHLKYLDHLVDWRQLENGRVVGKHGLDFALCALGTTIRSAGSQAAFRTVDHDYVVNFAHFAKARGANSFVLVSSLGADPKSRSFYTRVKGEAEQSLRAVGFASLTILRPSLLLGDREEFRIGERMGLWASRLAGPLLPLRYRPIAAAQVAKQMVIAGMAAEHGVRVIESDEIARLT